jgi:hypothetical protein
MCPVCKILGFYLAIPSNERRHLVVTPNPPFSLERTRFYIEKSNFSMKMTPPKQKTQCRYQPFYDFIMVTRPLPFHMMVVVRISSCSPALPTG